MIVFRRERVRENNEILLQRFNYYIIYYIPIIVLYNTRTRYCYRAAQFSFRRLIIIICI